MMNRSVAYLSGLAFAVASAFSSPSQALLDGSGRVIPTSPLIAGECDYEGYTLKLECDITKIKYDKQGNPLPSQKDLCTIIESYIGSKKVDFPEDICQPVIGVQISPYYGVEYCKLPTPCQKPVS